MKYLVVLLATIMAIGPWCVPTLVILNLAGVTSLPWLLVFAPWLALMFLVLVALALMVAAVFVGSVKSLPHLR